MLIEIPARAIRSVCALAIGLTLLVGAPAAPAQTYSINGSSAVMKSTGSATLSDIGYVGSYIKVPAGGATVKFTVNAHGSSGTTPGAHLNLVIADAKFGLRIDSTSKINYDAGTVTLPAGTYVVRVERDYENNATSKRSATVNQLKVTTLSGGAVKFSNTSNATNALAAANTYIQNFRQGKVSLTINGLPDNTPIQIHQTRSAFNFGTNMAGTNRAGYDSFVSPFNADPNKTPYLDHLTAPVPGTHVNYFNTITTEDAGKWGYHEPGATPPLTPDMTYVDDILDFAEANNLRARVTPLLWDFRVQQPGWVNSLLTAALRGDSTAKATLTTAIANRIKYYVEDRAQRYVGLDVLNEALKTPSFWRLLGAKGVAEIYSQVAAAAAAGGNPSLRAFTNEYNVLQNSTDAYSNWYSKNEIAALRNAGGAVSGIGIQYYVTSSPAHSASKIMKVLQNLATHGLPIALTEFGVQKGSSLSAAARYLDETMRLIYGTPEATDFLLWGFWQGHIWSGGPNGALWDKNWKLTPAGQVWTRLMQQWSTTLDNQYANGNDLLNFSGFYGDYEVIIGDQHFDLSLVKGISDYTINYVDPNAPIFDPPLPPGEITLEAPENVNLVSLPEPSSLALGALAAAGLLIAGRRRSRRVA